MNVELEQRLAEVIFAEMIHRYGQHTNLVHPFSRVGREHDAQMFIEVTSDFSRMYDNAVRLAEAALISASS